MSADCARSSISCPLDSPDSQMRVRPASVARMLLGTHVQVVRVLVAERRAHIRPVVREHRLEILLGRDHELGLRADEIQQRTEALNRQQLGDVGAFGVRAVARRRGTGERARGHLFGGELRELAVLERRARPPARSRPRPSPQRALRERREPAQRLDLDIEHVDPHRPLLSRRKHVKQAAPQRELSPLLNLIDALVAGADELRCALVEVEQLAHAQFERVRAQLRVRHLLRQRDRAHDHHRRLLQGALRGARTEQRIERRHAQTDEMRRRCQVRLVRDAARRVVANAPRRQPSAEVCRQVACRAVIADHHQRRS